MGDTEADRVRAVGAGAADDVARAMDRVLAAERAAAAAVDTCRAEAARAVVAARLEARARIERAERIAQAIHGRTEAVAARRAAALVAEATSAGGPARPVDAVVDELAAWLVGDADD
jgi:regulator of protease activity HflC (stomatin/prohibitin superfamily)